MKRRYHYYMKVAVVLAKDTHTPRRSRRQHRASLVMCQTKTHGPSRSALRNQVERLIRIGIALSSETDVGRLLERIVAEARAFTRADGGTLYIQEGGNLHFRVTQNETLTRRPEGPPRFHSCTLPVSKKSIAGYVAYTGNVLNIENVHDLPAQVPYRFNPELDLLNHYITRSVLGVPLKTPQGVILGVLQLVNATDRQGRVTAFPRTVEPLSLSLASQAAVALRNARLITDIKALFDALIRYSASAIDARSPHTAGHSRRVAAYAQAIAVAINKARDEPFRHVWFTPEEVEELVYAAWLHDIGKIGVPEQILDKGKRLSEEALATIRTRFELIEALGKNTGLSRCWVSERQSSVQGDRPWRTDEALAEHFAFIEEINGSVVLSEEDGRRLRRIGACTFTDLHGETRPYLTGKEMEALCVTNGNLTAREYMRIQTHVEHTLNIIRNVPFTRSLSNVPFYAATHHERLDGTGYPRGLTAPELPLQSRILAVADIFDALTAADRPYRRALSIPEACQALKAHAKAGRIDQDIVILFVHKRLYERLSRTPSGTAWMRKGSDELDLF